MSETLGKKIAILRTKRGLTQAQFAKKLNVSTSTIAMWETDARDPDTKMVAEMARFFGVSTDYLLGHDSLPSPSWATSKDKRDFKKMLEEDPEVMFDGVPIDDEDREKIKRVMEAIFWDAKKKNKRKPIHED